MLESKVKIWRQRFLWRWKLRRFPEEKLSFKIFLSWLTCQHLLIIKVLVIEAWVCCHFFLKYRKEYVAFILIFSHQKVLIGFTINVFLFYWFIRPRLKLNPQSIYLPKFVYICQSISRSIVHFPKPNQMNKHQNFQKNSLFSASTIIYVDIFLFFSRQSSQI